MLLGTRFGLCLLALSLNFSDAFSALNQPAPFASTMQNSTDGAAIRTLAEAFYKTWAAKDLDGFLSLWSAKAPELEARKKATGALYAGSERIELSDLRTRKVAMAGDCAVARVAVEVKVIDAKTGLAREGYGSSLRTLEFVREAGGWKQECQSQYHRGR